VFVLRKRLMGRYRFPLPARTTLRTLTSIRPDVIVAHFGGAAVAAAPLARRLDTPLIAVFHAFDLFARPFTPAYYAPLWRSGAHAVTVSRHGLRRLAELGCPPERSHLIHCGVDPNRFDPEKTLHPSHSPFRFISIGRLVEKKGLDILLRAMAIASIRSPDSLHLDIWGDGPLRGPLSRLSRRMNLSAVVAFRGSIEARDLPRILRLYDGFVLASRTAANGDKEGLPVTLLEAQAAGLPVVSTWHAGIPEALPPQNHGWLAYEGDADSLAARISALVRCRPDERHAIGENGRQWVARHFSLNDEIRAYRRLMEERVSLTGTLAGTHPGKDA
jgi:colanic acid/amylovoran biosynthesis glycosyltransferase